MPNHIVNRLAIIGTDKEVKKVRKAIANTIVDKDQFTGKKETWNAIIDFNMIIPMPKGLADIKADGLISWLDSDSVFIKYTKDDLIERLEKHDLESVKNFCKAIILFKKHGSASWYQWSIKHWGTKWNAYSQKEIAPNIIEFQTAWSMPEPVIRKLSLDFPGVKFHLEYADEDIGANCGIVEFVSGSKTDLTPFKTSTKEARKFARKLHDWKDEEHETV